MSEKSTVTPPLAAVTSRGALRRRLYVLAWPSVLENLLHSLVFMINTALVGRLGAEALGAAGIANHIMFFVITPVYVGLPPVSWRSWRARLVVMILLMRSVQVGMPSRSGWDLRSLCQCFS